MATGLMSDAPVTGSIVIKFGIEVEGREIFAEYFDVKAIGQEITNHGEDVVMQNWRRRLQCALCCEGRSGFVACLARCIEDGQCCDSGLRNCRSL